MASKDTRRVAQEARNISHKKSKGVPAHKAVARGLEKSRGPKSTKR